MTYPGIEGGKSHEALLAQERAYDANFPLGQWEPGLEGVAIQMSSASPDNIRFEFLGGDEATKTTFINALDSSPLFQRDSGSKNNNFRPEFHFLGERGKAIDAALDLAKNPEVRSAIDRRRVLQAETRRQEEDRERRLAQVDALRLEEAKARAQQEAA